MSGLMRRSNLLLFSLKAEQHQDIAPLVVCEVPVIQSA
ncbi:hypothetical protein KKH3_14220 [Pectobacterium actinidiae]|nr:hypothetical protein KKH3_14220 [Pectobacterium actinidiae]